MLHCLRALQNQAPQFYKSMIGGKVVEHPTGVTKGRRFDY